MVKKRIKFFFGWVKSDGNNGDKWGVNIKNDNFPVQLNLRHSVYKAGKFSNWHPLYTISKIKYTNEVYCCVLCTV